ncbi:MAG: glyoxalase [Ramlibacter sp.]|nr:glyoxalase [Ramlibacter sp.]
MQAPRSNPAMLSPFHLAFPVHDLAQARGFYGQTLGCPEGRSSDEWIDFNFYGHQIVAHLAPSETGAAQRNAVMADWEDLARRLREAGTEFVIEPYIRFKGEPGEQATMFFLDPSGNAIEIKAFTDISRLFAK